MNIKRYIKHFLDSYLYLMVKNADIIVKIIDINNKKLIANSMIRDFNYTSIRV